MSDNPALSLDDFLPYRLSVLSNAVSSKIARIYEQEFELSLSSNFLLIQVLIVLVDSWVLSVMLTIASTSFIKIFLLDLHVFILKFSVLHLLHLILLMLHLQLLIKGIEHVSFSLHLSHAPFIFRLNSDVKAIVKRSIAGAGTPIMGQLEKTFVLLFNHSPFLKFIELFPVLFILHLLGFSGNVVVVSLVLISTTSLIGHGAASGQNDRGGSRILVQLGTSGDNAGQTIT